MLSNDAPTGALMRSIWKNRPYTRISLEATNGTKVAKPFTKDVLAVRILIEKADWIVTVDANGRLLQSASVLIENDRIGAWRHLNEEDNFGQARRWR